MIHTKTIIYLTVTNSESVKYITNYLLLQLMISYFYFVYLFF
jgi:hypothetical protein